MARSAQQRREVEVGEDRDGGFEFDDTIIAKRSLQFSREQDCARIFVGDANIRVSRFPTLVHFDGGFDEEFSVNMVPEYLNPSGDEAPLVISRGGVTDGLLKMPLAIRMLNDFKAPSPPYLGLEEELFAKGIPVMLHVKVGSELMMRLLQGKQSEEMVDQLRNLGYLQ